MKSRALVGFWPRDFVVVVAERTVCCCQLQSLVGKEKLLVGLIQILERLASQMKIAVAALGKPVVEQYSV